MSAERPRSSRRQPDRSGPGRPMKFTPELGAMIVSYIQSGALFKDAARACGVPEATAYEWLARGEGRDPDRAPTPELTHWAQDIRRAQALPMVVASNWLFRNKTEVWLARRDPACWGPNGHARHDPPAPAGPSTASSSDVAEETER